MKWFKCGHQHSLAAKQAPQHSCVYFDVKIFDVDTANAMLVLARSSLKSYKQLKKVSETNVCYTVLQQKRNEVPFITIMLAVCDAVSLIDIYLFLCIRKEFCINHLWLSGCEYSVGYEAYLCAHISRWNVIYTAHPHQLKKQTKDFESSLLSAYLHFLFGSNLWWLE